MISFLVWALLVWCCLFPFLLSRDTKASLSLAHSDSQQYASIFPRFHVVDLSLHFVTGIPKQAMCFPPSAFYLINACAHFCVRFFIVLGMRPLHVVIEICPHILSFIYHASCTRRASPYTNQLLCILNMTNYYVFNNMPIYQLTTMYP